MFKVDLNCDMGESYGPYRMGKDEEILNYVSSANIACGFHAGDPSTMRKTVILALEKTLASLLSRFSRFSWFWKKRN